MRSVITALVMIGLAAYFGFWAGVRRERGRATLIREIETERRASGGVRLKSIRVKR